MTWIVVQVNKEAGKLSSLKKHITLEKDYTYDKLAWCPAGWSHQPHQIQNYQIYARNTIKFLSLNTKHLISVVFSTEYRLEMIIFYFINV